MSYLRKAINVDTLAELHHIPVCDFCGSLVPIWLYAADRTNTGEKERNWRWCACDICAKLIDDHEWDALEASITSHVPAVLLAGLGADKVHEGGKQALSEFHAWSIPV